jgi:hypothetical protein
MRTQWYKGVPKSDKKLLKERKGVILSAIPAFDVLTKILEDRIQDLQKSRDSEDVYQLPSYGFHQADHAGQIKAYRKIIDLLKLKESDHD